MKLRFTALDVRAAVSDLRTRVVGTRLQNIYDVNQKTFLLKFSKQGRKEIILVESGIRFHSTQFAREKYTIPTQFCEKIRKCCRTRRLTNLVQLGTDRIVDFEFAGEETGYHIVCEFYQAGNVILTDQNYVILALLREVKPNENLRIVVGETYNPESMARGFERVTRQRVLEVLVAADPKENLKRLLQAKLDYGAGLTEHAIRVAGLDPAMKVSTAADLLEGSPQFEALMSALEEADSILENTSSERPKGYLTILERTVRDKVAPPNPVAGMEDAEVTMYDEFHPYLFRQFQTKPHREFESFDQAVDEFFSKLETQKLEVRAQAQEEAALKKLEAVRLENEGRVRSLKEAQLTNIYKAELIETNMELVDQALLVVRNALANAMDWKDLADLVVEEQRKSNPIALVIDGLKLETGQITLRLSDMYVSSDLDEDDETEQVLPAQSKTWKVDIEVNLSAHANARKYYEVKKQSASKEDKTLAAANKAMKNAERKVLKDLQETKTITAIKKIRKPLWFEKFLWFISQERYLVIAGRDAQQNELVAKKYLRKADAYVHANLSGAASVVVRNVLDGGHIPPGVLAHAGIMSMCQSRAWEAKIVTSAWWVTAEQVSKTAPTGEYLTTGSFMVRGKKNFLPPAQLVYGFGILFRLDESSTARHIAIRKAAEAERPNSEVGSYDPNAEDATKENLELEEEVVAAESADSIATAGMVNGGENFDEEREGDFEGAEGEDMDNEQNVDREKGELSEDGEDQPPSRTDKYGLAEFCTPADEEDFAPVGSDGRARSAANEERLRGYLSAKERKERRKQRAKGTALQDGQGDPERDTLAPAPGKSDMQIGSGDFPGRNETVTPPPQQPARGRKAKLKKIKAKYGEQDEEERALRMEILGSAKGPQPKGKKAKREAEAAAEAAARRERRDAQRKAVSSNSVNEASDQQPGEQPIYVCAAEDMRSQDLVVDKNEAAEIRQMLKEENIVLLDEEESENISLLESLTGSPLPEDVLVHAIPVCAPYPVLQRYKYKVKLTPGTTKKGKAVKEAVKYFLASADSTPREKELIKSIPDTEMISQMIAKVKVSAPNLEAVKKKAKQKSRKK